MKILLVSYYWYPWNNSGAFRWLNLSKYIRIDGLITAKEPGNSFEDETMPKGKVGIIIRMIKMPAVIWGVMIAPVVLIASAWFDKVIFTITPESLLLPAWILQLFGKDVYVDMRDAIERSEQKNKWLVPVYKWLYRRIKKVCVCMRFIDPTKRVIRHGYEDWIR